MAARLSIGDFGRMALLSVKALRHYHEIGLLEPASVDEQTGYRTYELSQVPIAQVIRRLRGLRMPIDEVKAVLSAPDLDARNAAIVTHLRRMELELQGAQAAVASLRALIEASSPAIDIELRVSPSIYALRCHASVISSEVMQWKHDSLVTLRRELRESGLFRAGPDTVLYSRELLEEERGDVTALIPVQRASHVSIVAVPSSEYAVAAHRGSFDDIDLTFAALGAFVTERAIGIGGAIRENYLVGDLDDDRVANHRTEICWPVFLTAPATSVQ